MQADLLLPENATPETASGALRAHLRLRERGVVETDRTFYDTFDGLLHHAGLSAAHASSRLSVFKADGSEDGTAAEWASAPRRVLAIELEEGPLRDALLPVVGVRALLAQAHVRIRAREYDVLDDAEKTVVRLTLSEPAVVASEQRLIPLRPRVQLVLVRGYDKELSRTRTVLERELGLTAPTEPLVDEAVRAAGRDPGGRSSKPAVKLSAEQRTDAAAVAVLRALLDVIHANLEGTIADLDAEFLHDFRVAIRRSRAVQRELKRAFPPTELERFRTELRWLQRSTGDARDMDVYVLDFDRMRTLVPEGVRADLDPLLAVLRSHRLTARREMVRALRSDRAAAVLSDWAKFLDSVAAGRPDAPGAAAAPIRDSAGARIAKVYRRMVKEGRAIDDASPPEALHELRKKGKELRYLLELFGAQLFAGDVVKPMVKTLKALQDVLGRHQDREVQGATLRELREEVSALPGGPGALMAMGLLVDRVGADQRAARAEFADTFAAFASKGQRRIVNETFGGG
jgi:CHAD domain-containing protein